jgi:hypothetical protein
MGKRNKQNFYKGRSPSAQKKLMKDCSTSLAIKEIQVETIVKIPPQFCRKGHHQEKKQQQMLARI